MDKKTVLVYDRDANDFADDWCSQPEPTDLYAILQQFFQPGLTADIGCGIGRDTAWLNANGFPTIGYDVSEGLLSLAKQRHPDLCFYNVSLPALTFIENNKFTNVLCETVIMHLSRDLIGPAVRRLMAILKPDGILYLSWRITEEAGVRDNKGRLYTAFNSDLVIQALNPAAILLNKQIASASSGKLIHRIVARKLTNT